MRRLWAFADPATPCFSFNSFRAAASYSSLNFSSLGVGNATLAKGLKHGNISSKIFNYLLK